MDWRKIAPMRFAKHISTIALSAILVAVTAYCATAVPLVGFSPNSMSITASGTFRTPPITIQNATGVTAVSLTITIPIDITINTSVSSGNLECVNQGTSVNGLFFSEWDAATRRITVTAALSPGSNIEVIRSIQFSTSSTLTASQVTLGGSVTGGSGAALFGSLSLVPPHSVSVTTCTATPSTVDSSGSSSCSASATDSTGHTAFSYRWSDGNAGGTFSPSANSQNVTYRAPVNITGSDTTVTLRCDATCTQNATVSGYTTTALTVRSVPNKTINITSTPNTGASITYTPATDRAGKTSPQATTVAISYLQTATGISITAPKQDGAAHPLWFSHWSVDSVNQAEGTRAITVNMNLTDHSLCAVYGKLVGDLNQDGHVDKADAELILKALLGDATTTTEMDVDLSGTVDIKDAKWIMGHLY